jgi:hypothetical protein
MSARMDRLRMKWRAMVRDLRLGWQLWWLRQQVEFFEWRIQWSALLPQPVANDESNSKPSGGRRGGRTLSCFHGQGVFVRSAR